MEHPEGFGRVSNCKNESWMFFLLAETDENEPLLTASEGVLLGGLLSGEEAFRALGAKHRVDGRCQQKLSKVRGAGVATKTLIRRKTYEKTKKEP